MYKAMDLSGMKQTFDALREENTPGGLILSDIYLASKGNGAFDFADDMTSKSREGGNGGDPAVGVFARDGVGGFFKFQNQNTLYNIYDAGNFLTGNAYMMMGIGLGYLQTGAHVNNFFSLRRRPFGPSGFRDSPADQKALADGYNYHGIKWSK